MKKLFTFFIVLVANLGAFQQTQEIVAWHEAGHALALLCNQDLGNIHQVTICPDLATKSLGRVVSCQPGFITFDTTQTEQEIIACLCGGVAEQIYLHQPAFKNKTEILHYFAQNRFASDIQQALHKAREIFTINSLHYYNQEQVQQKIEETIARLYFKAYKFLALRKDQLKKIADQLMLKNSLTNQEIYNLIIA